MGPNKNTIPKLKRNLQWWLLLIGLLITIPILIYVALWTRNSTLQQLHATASDDLNVNLAYMQSQIDNMYIITRLVSTNERVLMIVNQPDNLRLKVRVNHFLARFNVTASTIAYILDTDGRVLASGNWDAPDSFVGKTDGLLPYLQTALDGKPGQYVTIESISGQLGYYIALPIRIDGRIKGMAVTKTDPQELILFGQKSGRPFLVTDANGIVIIASEPGFLFKYIVKLSPGTLEHIREQKLYSNEALQPISSRPIETVKNIALMTMKMQPEAYGESRQQRFVITTAAVPPTLWSAHTLFPLYGLNATLAKNLLVTLLIISAILLSTLFLIERWRHVKQLHIQAIRDPLTSLYTRLYMLESAGRLLATHDRQSIEGVCAILFDIDHFKSVNDGFGHSAGDNVLVRIAKLLLNECRDSDIPIRYGGEELLLFVPSGNIEQAVQLAERIRSQIERLIFNLAGQQTHLTVSGGIASHLPGESLEKLIDRADQMLYQAKQQGRNQICWKQNEERDPKTI